MRFFSTSLNFLAFCVLSFTQGLFADEPAAAQTPSVDSSATSAVVASPIVGGYPANTFLVARLKGFGSLEKALGSVKEWIAKHPSVESLMDDDQWKRFEAFNLRQTFANSMDLSQKEFDDFFDGPLTVCVGGDFSWAKESKMMPVVIEMTTSSAEKAKEFETILKNEENVTQVSQAAEGVDHIRFKSVDKTSGVAGSSTNGKKLNDAKEAPAKEEVKDAYLALEGATIIIGNNLDYTIAARNAARATTGDVPAFLESASDADVAVWVDPRPMVALLKAQLEAKAKTDAPGKIDPAIIDNLGLSEIDGVGLKMNFTKETFNVQLSYAVLPTGLARLFNCAPTGLTESPLIPADAEEFTIGRMDISALWTEVRRVAKIVVPATDTIYTGWKKQVQETYGVDVEKQLFGGFGDQYATFHREGEKNDGTAMYLAITDPVAMEGSLNAFFGFFTEGKEMFDRSKIGNTPVWRLKNEYQTSGASSIGYAITSQWLIISVGDPTELQDLVESADSREVTNPVFGRTVVKDLLKNSAVVSFSHRPLKNLLEDVAEAMQQVRAREAKKAGKEIPEADIPDFDDVKDSVLIYSESNPGSLCLTVQITPNDED